LDLLEIFSDTSDLETFPAGTVILEEGTEGDLMYVVVEGEAAVSLRGKELAIARPGEIVGEMALINSELRSATVTAKTDCKLAAIDQASFESLLRHVPDFSKFVMTLLASRLLNAYEMIER
jgi:CRP/FNR family transcriptional regulator, cyclic AMP receptor protein